ncbi:MAG: hypothetical protein HQL19_08250 [Candidatus Omnitrophica bacterium]|nr:hypothetical protein [Candidatus Omnitrophota bacterium]
MFNYIKEDVDLYSSEMIPRKYFSGGFSFFGFLKGCFNRKVGPVESAMLIGAKVKSFILVVAALSTTVGGLMAQAGPSGVIDHTAPIISQGRLMEEYSGPKIVGGYQGLTQELRNTINGLLPKYEKEAEKLSPLARHKGFKEVSVVDTEVSNIIARPKILRRILEELDTQKPRAKAFFVVFWGLHLLEECTPKASELKTWQDLDHLKDFNALKKAAQGMLGIKLVGDHYDPAKKSIFFFAPAAGNCLWWIGPSIEGAFKEDVNIFVLNYDPTRSVKEIADKTGEEINGSFIRNLILNGKAEAYTYSQGGIIFFTVAKDNLELFKHFGFVGNVGPVVYGGSKQIESLPRFFAEMLIPALTHTIAAPVGEVIKAADPSGEALEGLNILELQRSMGSKNFYSYLIAGDEQVIPDVTMMEDAKKGIWPKNKKVKEAVMAMMESLGYDFFSPDKDAKAKWQKESGEYSNHKSVGVGIGELLKKDRDKRLSDEVKFFMRRGKWQWTGGSWTGGSWTGVSNAVGNGASFYQAPVNFDFSNFQPSNHAMGVLNNNGGIDLEKMAVNARKQGRGVTTAFDSAASLDALLKASGLDVHVLSMKPLTADNMAGFVSPNL